MAGGTKVAGGKCSTLEIELFKQTNKNVEVFFLNPHLYLISVDKNLKNLVLKVYGYRDICLSVPPFEHSSDYQAVVIKYRKTGSLLKTEEVVWFRI